jgi:PRC-barrel domain
VAHYGTLHNFRFSNEADDIRGATLYDAQDQKLGMIVDLIFDHESGNVKYAIVDAGNWFPGRYFLVPAIHITSRDEERNEYRIDITREQVKRLPAYEEGHLANDKKWRNYDEKYRRALEAAIAGLVQTEREHSLDQPPQAAIDELWTIEGDSRFSTQDLLMIGSEVEEPGRQTSTESDTPRAAGSLLGARTGRRWLRFEDHVRDELDRITGDCTTCEELRRSRWKEAA